MVADITTPIQSLLSPYCHMTVPTLARALFRSAQLLLRASQTLLIWALSMCHVFRGQKWELMNIERHRGPIYR